MKRIWVIFVFLGGVALGTGWLLGVMATGAEAETAVVAHTLSQTTDTECTGTNLLTNPSFEGQYSDYILPPPGHPDCGGTVCERAQMAPGWSPWWADSPRNETWQNIMPEYTQSTTAEVNPDRVRSGDKSQHYFSFWSTHIAGLYQQVTATVGARYCFTVWGHAWSARTSSDFYSDPDPDNGELIQKIGIDPAGGTDWQSPTIIWSDAREQYDTFGLFRVEAVAQASKITVFMYSSAAQPVKHNDVYWDDAFLSQVKQMEVTPPGIYLMADKDIPVVMTQTVSISQSVGLTWTVQLDPMGSITPLLSTSSGTAGQNLTVTIDTTGLVTGTYTNTLTITAAPDVNGSPAQLPIGVYVAPEVWSSFLPVILRP
ncbi:MAG: hypothetical protein D6706_03785 [Chloroflexi bacterium]|nr:MAG: hypothetical protein D6706_03785 [Chloroflexota bacterium]